VPSSRSFLDLLYAGASEADLDRALREQVATAPGERTRLEEEHRLALRLRDRMSEQRRREAELSALYETARDLIAIRDVDTILTAIVRRARQLLGADMTYLSLNDEDEGASYMKVTDGSVSAEFRNLRLPLGTGLLGLVAQTGAPYYTDDYQHDQRFKHRDYIDHAVNDERIRAILGVPLLVEGKVIGALLAGHRTVRPFPPAEVTLLTSFAAHAAVALENARLFQATESAMAEVDEANRQLREHTRAVEQAAQAHDRLTDVLLHGGGVDEVATVLADVLDADLAVCDADGVPVAQVGETGAWDLTGPLSESLASGRSADAGAGRYVAAALAGAEHLGTLVVRSRAGGLVTADRRTLERGAVVTALLLLFRRSVAAAEDRVRGELLADLLSGREDDPVWLRERARRHRVELDRVAVVAVATVHAGDRHRAGRAAARLGVELSGLGGEHEGRLVLLAGSEPPTTATEGLGPLAVGHQLQAALAGAEAEATVGVVPVGDSADPGALAAAWQVACSCVDTLETLGRRGDVSDPVGLGLARLLLGRTAPEELDAYLERTLGPVTTYDAQRGTELMRTLQAWFDAGGRAGRAAEVLHVHPNTVAQRLDRIGELLGPDWREPGAALEQQVALRLWQLCSRK
jgi:GAF domain-containing protein/sugar diacid utilization regulator